MNRFSLIAGALVLFSVSIAAQEFKKVFDAPLVAIDESHRMDELADMDGDGDLDAVGWWWTNSNRSSVVVSIIDNGVLGFTTNSGSVSVTVPYINSAPATTWASTMADVDNDGTKEFILAIGGQLVVLNRAAIVNFWASPVLSETIADARNGVAAGDFDGDGDVDIAVSDEGALRYYFRNGAGFFMPGPVVPATGILQITSGDVDGDGVEDVVALGASDIRIWSFSGGTPILSSTWVHGNPQLAGKPVRPSIGDVDGDNDIDIVVFSFLGSYVLMRGDGAGNFAVQPSALGGPADRLVDIDSDGDLDGVCCGGGSTTSFEWNDITSNFLIAYNDGNGNFANSVAMPGLGADKLAGAADVDGDGDLDLVGGRCVYYADGPITQPVVGMGPVGGVGLAGAIDLDGDFDADLPNDAHSAMFNSAAGGFVSKLLGAQAAPGTIFGEQIGHGDFDGDGNIDFICEVLDASSLSFINLHLLKGDGNGHFSLAGPCALPGQRFLDGGNAPAHPKWSFAADVDDDGDMDFVAGALDYSEDSRVWINDGLGFFTAGAPVGPVSTVVDLDLDGMADLLLNNSVIRWGLPGANWTLGQSYGVTFSVTNRVKDVDGDGLLDIVIFQGSSSRALRNMGGRAFQVLIGPGLGVYAAPEMRSFIDIADIDLNGTLDMVSSTVQAWYMPRTMSVRKNVSFGVASASWQIVAPHVMSGHSLVDIDGDGDLDLVGDRIYKNLTKTPANSGIKFQYGEGAVGGGGFVPRLNVVGALGAGDTATLKVTGLRVGTLMYFVYGDTPVVQQGYPLPTLTNYTNATEVLPFVADGQFGVPGVGTWDLPFLVPMNLSGTVYYQQIYAYDPLAPGNFTCSAGLAILYK